MAAKKKSNLNFGGLPQIPTKSTATRNPLGVGAEDALKVSGVGAAFGLAWGDVTVGTAIQGFEDLAHAASGKGAAAARAKQQLAQIQQDLYIMGEYGTKQPTHGAIGTNDLTAIRKALIGAASSGQRFADYLNNQVTQSQAAGTTGGGGTHIIPAGHVPETVYTADNIRAVLDAAESATGQNVAQRLIGRDFSESELSQIASQMNVSSAALASAQQKGVLAQQQQDISTATGVYPNQAVTKGGKVTPQQVATEIAHAGGTPLQQQVGAALITGIESNGDPNAKNPSSTASGLFQFLDTTWASLGGTAFAPTARGATWQQQVKVFVKASAGNNFYPWAPDLGGAYNGRAIYSPQPGSRVARAIASLGIKTGSGQNAAAMGASSASPVGPGLKQGRVDQGVDWSGRGPLFAIGAGTILSTKNTGWPGAGTFIALKLDNPPDPQHSVVYYAEDITPNVRVGEHVGAGRQIGMATGGSSGIEIGWGNPNAIGQPLAQVSRIGVPHNLARQLPGTDIEAATGQGAHFLNYIKGTTTPAVNADWAGLKAASQIPGATAYLEANAPGVSGTAPGGNQGQIQDVYQTPVIDQVPVQLSPAEAATQFVQTEMPQQWQTNNLLRMFQMLQTKLASPDPSLAEHVRQGPVVMK